MKLSSLVFSELDDLVSSESEDVEFIDKEGIKSVVSVKKQEVALVDRYNRLEQLVKKKEQMQKNFMPASRLKDLIGNWVEPNFIQAGKMETQTPIWNN